MRKNWIMNSQRIVRVVFVIIGIFLGIGSAWSAPAGSRWGSSYFPNIALVNQDGKKVRFYEDLIRGKVVAVNFIFTHCKDSCPAETANLKQVEKLLGDQLGRDVFMYSISIDPKYDSPKALKNYAKKFKARPGWMFLTGKESDITLLRKKLGLLGNGGKETKLGDHNLSFIVGNETTGQWIKRSAFDHPKVLAHLLGNSLQTLPTPAKGLESYSVVQALPRLTRGEDLFRSRCDSCHSLGTQDGVGPGLAGVTSKRSHAWLARWLRNPDQLLAQKDPIAEALFVKYDKVQMPNLKLSDEDVEALIHFMKIYENPN